MSQDNQRATPKRRKLYLSNESSPFVVPRSTAWFNKQRLTASIVAADTSPSTPPHRSPTHDPMPPDSAGAASGTSSVAEHSGESHLGVADVASEACSSEECCQLDSSDDNDTSEAHDGAFSHTDDIEPRTDAASEGDCSSDEYDDLDDSAGGPHADAVPPFDSADLLAQCVQDFGRRTLPGSSTTLAEAIILIMAFVVAHGLTWSALGDLLKLVDALFGYQQSGLPRSKYLFRKFWAPKCAGLVRHHFYCETCLSLLQTTKDSQNLFCIICKTEAEGRALKKKGSYFVIMDLKEQLRLVTRKAGDLLFTSLRKLAERMSAGKSALMDISNAAVCQGLRQRQHLRWSDLTLTVNTDGSPLFKSNNSSIWPIQICVNELPQPHRTDNSFLAGLWFGSRHPDMTLFVGEFVKALQTVGEVAWQHGAATVASKVYIACVCVDAPARASVGNHTQFNGLFGCPWCLACGKLEEGRRLYTITEPPAEQRTSKGVRDNMKLAVKLQTPVNGLKGPSPLCSLRYLDLVSCYTVEYMHCVLLGVTRQFTEYWFDSSCCHERYYIGRPSTVNTLNRRLTSIRPPHHITRLPRAIQERHFWKAHEWRNWLLFYCVPCCLNTLPAQYLRHFALLCEAIFILLQEQLSPAAISSADRLLRLFVSRAAALYGERCMSFNVHQLTHLSQAARNFGPLWAHSAFGFESGNGHIVKLVTAANGVPDQILERVIMSQELDLLLSSNVIPPRGKQLCSNFLQYAHVEKARYVQGACVLGAPKEVPVLLPAERAALELLLNSVPQVQEYFRFLYRETVMHSREYRRGVKSDSSIIESQDGEFFVIKRIFEVVGVGQPSNGEVVLLCGKIVREECELYLPGHITQCFFSLECPLVALSLSMVAKPCILLTFSNEENYICRIPNLVERD